MHRSTAPSIASRELTRRGFLQAGAAGLCAAAGGRLAARPPGRYEGLETERYLGEVRVLARVEAEKTFLEGPAADRKGQVFFTNIPASVILKWDPASRAVSVFREKSNEANGLHFDRQGRLLVCEGSARRLTRIDMESGKTEVLADSYRGFPLAPPNDLCLDRRGRIYFTSRPGASDPHKGNVNAVYRLDPDGTLDQILSWPRVHMPNGIVTSGGDETLYVVEAHPDEGHHRDIRAYDLKPDGTVRDERKLIDFYPGRSGDGMAIDEAGNLYVAAGLHRTRGTSETLDTRPGIHVVSPQGKLLGYRETPEDTVTNCAFGGPDRRTLYMTCGSLLLALRTRIAGKPG